MKYLFKPPLKLKKILIAVCFITLLAGGLTLVIIFFNSGSVKLILITDIHAGSKKARQRGDEPNNIIIPRNFENNLKVLFKNEKDANFYITIGDNLDQPSEKYLNKLRLATEDRPMLWIIGNHDKSKLFKHLSVDEYYAVDINKKWKIIILNNAANYPKEMPEKSIYDRGYIDLRQLEWLKNTLNTEQQLIIITHVPLLKRNDLNSIREDQVELWKIFRDSGNVKHIFSGHFHVVNLNKNIDGINYHILPAFSLKDNEGYYFTLELN